MKKSVKSYSLREINAEFKKLRRLGKKPILVIRRLKRELRW